MKKKILIVAQIVLIMVFAASCTKDSPNVPKLKDGSFSGNFGGDSFNLINCKTCNIIMNSTLYSKGNNSDYQFKFEIKRSSHDNIYGYNMIHYSLRVNMANYLNQKLYTAFETPMNMDDSSKPWVSLYYHKIFGNSIYDFKMYTSRKDKSDLKVKILSIEYSDIKVPSITGIIEGYLYNMEDPKDRIPIKAEFITQASY